MNKVIIEGNIIEYFTKSQIYQNNIPFKELFLIAYQTADHISGQLNIPCPDIGYVPKIHCHNIEAGTISEQFGKTYTTDDIPELSNNFIIISFQMINYERLVGVLAHEMRHIWQHIYNPTINHYPAQGFMEALTHPAEIDADGYAIYYMSQKLNITLNNAAEIICPEECQHYPDDYIIRIKKATEIKDNMQSKSNKKSSAFNRFLRLRKGEN